MNIRDFSTHKDSFYANRLSCLRGEYMHNTCDLCIKECYKEALYFDHQGKITLDSEKCTLCDACVGVCPTEALFDLDFDQNKYLEESDAALISCQVDFPCIGILNAHHLIYLATNKSQATQIDITLCAGCEKNSDMRVLRRFKKVYEETKNFLSAFDRPFSLNLVENYTPNTRREFFKKLVKRKTVSPKEMEKKGGFLPDYLGLFSRSLDALKEDDATLDLTKITFLHNKRFSNTCEGCKDCALFCPTEAIRIGQSNTEFTLDFNPFLCVGCGNCEDVCKKKAIESDEALPANELLRKKGVNKLTLLYNTCKVCKCAFLSSEESTLCSRCAVSEKMDDIFAIAKDLEDKL